MPLSTNAQGVIGGLGAGLLGGLGNLFGTPTPETTTTNKTNNSTSTPTYSSAVLPLYNQLLSSYMQRANGGAADSFLNSYQSQGQQNINQASQGGTNNLRTILAQRGQLFGPSASSSLIQQELARQGQQTNFTNSIPQLRYQLQSQDLQNAGNFFSALPHGQTSSGTETDTQKNQPAQASWIGPVLGGAAKALPSLLSMF